MRQCWYPFAVPTPFQKWNWKFSLKCNFPTGKESSILFFQPDYNSLLSFHFYSERTLFKKIGSSRHEANAVKLFVCVIDAILKEARVLVLITNNISNVNEQGWNPTLELSLVRGFS
jgi:hypothetical protein